MWRVLAVLCGLLFSIDLAAVSPNSARAQAITCPPNGSAGPTCTYQPDNVHHPTPAGGPWIHVDLLHQPQPEPPLDKLHAGTSGIRVNQQDPASPLLPPLDIVHAYICLSSVASPPNTCPNGGTIGWTSAMTGPLQAAFDNVRAARLKVIIRFIYNYGPTSVCNPPCSGPNPPLPPDRPIADIIADMTALAPVVLANADVIYALQAGFIGYWGEWHNSSNPPNDQPDAHNEFLDAFRALFQGKVDLQIRYPYALLDYAKHLGIAPTDYRTMGLGIHNDSFASSADDRGTFTPMNGYTGVMLEATAAGAGAALTTAGEFSAVYPEKQDCTHFPGYAQTYSLASQNFQTEPQVIQNWLPLPPGLPPCYDRVLRSIGPHLVLDKATFTSVRLGDGVDLTISLTMRNVGLSSLPQDRPIQIFAAHPNPSLPSQLPPFRLMTIPGDLTTLAPNGARQATFVGTVHLVRPGGFNPPPLNLYVHLPDPNPGLAAIGDYALPIESSGLRSPFAGMNFLGLLTF